MPSKEFSATIQTPFCVINPKVTRNTPVSELFDLIRTTIGLRETWYFGFQYESNGIQKYAKLKKKVTSCSKTNEVKFRLRLRFYPEDVYEFIEDTTRAHAYQEVKEQIISGQIYCPSEAALLLASYQAVIRYEKYDPEVHKPGYLNIKNYIPAHVLESHNFTDEQWETKITALHKEHGDMLKQDAIMEYLKIAQELDMYGITYYSIKNKKNTMLWLGIGAFGMNVYDYNNKLTGELSFQWGEIHKLSYRGNKFTIKPQDKSASSIVFYCASTAECKEILSTCTGNLNLHFRRQNTEDPIEVQQMKVMAKEMQMAREAERERLIAERTAREEAERRLSNMERALREQELAFEKSQASLSSYQQRVKDLEEQLEAEKRARMELEAMQQRLQEFNQQLERESLASSEERAKLLEQREAVMQEIERQQQLLKEQEEEKARLQALVNKASDLRLTNGNGKSDSDEREVQFPEGLKLDEQIRDARMATDKDYAKQMELMKKDLDAAKNPQKLQKVDIIYEENLRKGMDKFQTLRLLRQGNTKKRVEQFECL